MRSVESSASQPPVAERDPVTHEHHGLRRTDPYVWMRDTTDPRMLANLEAEAAYYRVATDHLRSKVRTLSGEMTSRVPAADSSVSFRRLRFSYYTRTPTGREYAQLCRHVGRFDARDPSDATDSVVLLDPQDLKGESPYVDLGLTLVSPDERLLAYSVDTTGDEVYRLRFRDLETLEDLPDEIPRSYYSGAWSADASTFFYTVHDAAYRPHQVWRHRVGTAAADDVLVLEETDQQFDLEVRGCRSGDVVLVTSASRDTTEVWWLDAHRPDRPATCVQPRSKGREYRCEHARTPAGDLLLVVTNDDAEEFRLAAAPLSDCGLDRWRTLVAEDPDERLYEVTAFEGHVVTSLRRAGRLMARAYRLTPEGDLALPGADIAPADATGTLELADNEWFPAHSVTVVERSYTEPSTWSEVDLDTGQRTLLRRQPVPGYDATAYTSTRTTVPARDGTAIPVTLVHRRDVPLDGTAPCLMYGYGAYEAVFEPEFDPALSVLLDHGVVFAHAHVRGGGEGGRRWWLDGRLEHKHHTFDDHVDAARGLVAAGLVDPERIATRGLSAGGLLQGVVFSQAPDTWRAVVAEVPFVDVVTTMLDASVPLTANEWDEWGDPRRAEDFAWMLAYSPYDNLPPRGRRPPLLVTGALHDPRVMVSEPAKWVAALRASDPEWSPRCLFRAETGAGAHTGPSGRFAHLYYEAEVYAWVLDQIT